MYERTTRDIQISVEPTYLEDESQPDDGQYVWAYRIRIRNGGQEAITLRHRYWKVTDAQGRVQEVRGAGVIGEQPRIEPGEVFEYTSGTPLNTPSGIMMGSYEMENEEGDLFDVEIPAFSLDSPYQLVLLQ